MTRHSYSQFMRFCLVGGVAFAVDAAVLEIAVALGIGNLTLARGLSLLTAMQVAYALNLLFTFRQPHSHGLRTWARFMTSNLAGAAINYGVFMGTLRWALTEGGHTERIAAIVAGTGVALFFNYWANQRFVFKGKAS